MEENKSDLNPKMKEKKRINPTEVLLKQVQKSDFLNPKEAIQEKTQESNPLKGPERSKKSGSKSKERTGSAKTVTKLKGKGKKKKNAKKQIDPLILKQQFEDWKQTDEYKKWLELSELKKEFPEITETSDDLTGKWQTIENKIFVFLKFFKVKTKMKELKHEHIRSFFFAREDKDNFQIDGVIAGVIKEHSDNAWHLRRKFIDVWKGLDEIHDYDENTFQAGRKKMAKDLTDLLKMMTPHIKGPHKEIYNEKLALILKPLSDLLKSNMRLSLFEQAYPDQKAREIVNFKYDALKERFCIDLQAVLFVLHAVEKDPEKQLIANPNVRNIFKKLERSDWEKSPIEFFYLSKLRHSFFLARKHMVKLFVNGIDYWKIPLSNNQQTLEDLKRLVDYELICERLFGDQLKRDQANFAYASLDLIMKTPGQSKMLDKEETFTKYAIPKLFIFKNLQQIRTILDAQKQIRLKNEIESVQGGLYFQFSVSKIKIPPEILEKMDAAQTMNENKLRPKSAFLTSNLINSGMRPRSALAKDFPLEESKEMTKGLETISESEEGRMWLFENYVDENTKDLFLETAEELRHINVSVQQDIEDIIITEGLNISREVLEHRDKYRDEIKKTREFLDHLKLNDNKKDQINSRRPPLLWNDPVVYEEAHNYRSIAAPQECYKDNRVQSIIEKIEYLGQHLLGFQTPWIDDLITRTIDVFKNDFQPKPLPLIVYLPK